MADVWLVVGLWAFWVGVWALTEADHAWHGRPLSDGPSLAPIVPVVPIAALGVGWLLNRLSPWLGTGVIGGSHVLGAVYLCARAVNRRPGVSVGKDPARRDRVDGGCDG